MVSLWVALAGVVITAFGVWLLYRIDPESPRYLIPTAARMKGLPKPYLKNYLRDQQVRTLVVLAGTVVQGIAVVMAFWAD
jgi:hypothetical protein